MPFNKIQEFAQKRFAFIGLLALALLFVSGGVIKINDFVRTQTITQPTTQLAQVGGTGTYPTATEPLGYKHPECLAVYGKTPAQIEATTCPMTNGEALANTTYSACSVNGSISFKGDNITVDCVKLNAPAGNAYGIKCNSASGNCYNITLRRITATGNNGGSPVQALIKWVNYSGHITSLLEKSDISLSDIPIQAGSGVDSRVAKYPGENYAFVVRGNRFHHITYAPTAHTDGLYWIESPWGILFENNLMDATGSTANWGSSLQVQVMANAGNYVFQNNHVITDNTGVPFNWGISPQCECATQQKFNYNKIDIFGRHPDHYACESSTMSNLVSCTPDASGKDPINCPSGTQSCIRSSAFSYSSRPCDVNSPTWPNCSACLAGCPSLTTAPNECIGNTFENGDPFTCSATGDGLVSGTTPTQSCGNNVKEGTEFCDGSNINGQSCTTQGFTGGTLFCNASCTAYNTSSCTTSGTPPPVGTTLTLGTTAIGSTAVVGGTTDGGSSNYMNATKFTTGSSGGTAQGISAYVTSPLGTSPNNKFSMALYANDATTGKPGTLIAQTTPGTLTGNAWNTLPISATLSPNTPYWLAYNTNGSVSTQNNITYNSGSTGQTAWRPQPFGTGSWTSPFNSTGVGPYQYSFYLTYTTGTISSFTITPTIEGSSPISRSFTLAIHQTNNSTPLTTKASLIPTGTSLSVTGLSLTPGTYDLFLSTPGYLKKKVNQSLSNNLSVSFPILLAGNLNDDNIINSIDWSYMSGEWNTANTKSDINKDGTVNSIDFSYLNKNWDKTGD